MFNLTNAGTKQNIALDCEAQNKPHIIQREQKNPLGRRATGTIDDTVWRQCQRDAIKVKIS